MSDVFGCIVFVCRGISRLIHDSGWCKHKYLTWTREDVKYIGDFDEWYPICARQSKYRLNFLRGVSTSAMITHLPSKNVQITAIKLFTNIKLQREYIVCGLDTGKILVWNRDFGNDRWEVDIKLGGHVSEITCLNMQLSFLASGSKDSDIYLFDNSFSKMMMKLEGHTDWIRSINVQDDKIVSCSRDKSCRIWDIEFGSCVRETKFECVPWIVHTERDRMIIGGESGTVSIMDRHGTTSTMFKAHQDNVTGIHIFSEHDFVTSSYDHFIKRWDMRNLSISLYERDTDRSIHSLAYSNHFITCSDKGTLLTWDQTLKPLGMYVSPSHLLGDLIVNRPRSIPIPKLIVRDGIVLCNNDPDGIVAWDHRFAMPNTTYMPPSRCDVLGFELDSTKLVGFTKSSRPTLVLHYFK